MTYRARYLATALLGATGFAAPIAASAQPVSGIYIGAGAGGNFMQPPEHKFEVVDSAFSFPSPTFANPANIGTIPRDSFVVSNRRSYDPGAVGTGSVGYGFGNGVRVEVEGNYRYNALSHVSGTDAREQKYGAMVNALFDLDIGSRYVFPYFGGGAGFQHVDHAFDFHSNNVFAYQGIGGLAFPIPGAPGLSATLEYRFLGLADSKFTQSTPGGTFSPAVSQTTKFTGDLNHSLLIGVRYAFNVAPPPMEASPAAPGPQAAAARTYLVFFDWDRADLSERARQIIAEAARASTRVQTTSIDVQGNADRSGTPAYNQGLSLRRAKTVSAELVRDGIPAAAITIQAFGDTKPLVPTAAGVREPQNRRVAIILH